MSPVDTTPLLGAVVVIDPAYPLVGGCLIGIISPTEVLVALQAVRK